MSYHIEGGNVCFKKLPSRILMREDGYLSAYRLDGKPIADYWYVPESECLKLRTENAKLREYVTKLEQANIVLDSDNTDLLCDMKDMQFFIAENSKLRELVDYMTPIAWYAASERERDRMRELGVEVD